MTDGFARCSFTLPPDQAQMLSHVAKRVGASQSAVLSILLQEPATASIGRSLFPLGMTAFVSHARGLAFVYTFV
jgi:hypothetical protein